MQSHKIEFNGVEVSCRSDGMVSWSHLSSGKILETFGSKSNGYRTCRVNRKSEKVHRLIAKAFLDDYSDDLAVDHINGDRSDNRPSNLRMVTNSQNQRGFTQQNRGVSKYRGVVEGNRPNRWKSHVRIDGKQKTIGASFRCEESAALARDVAAYNNGYPLEGLNFPWIFNIQPAQ